MDRISPARQDGSEASLKTEEQGKRELDLLSAEEVAAAFEVSPKTVANWVARREIPFVRRGKSTWFLRESLREWLLTQETKPYGGH
jgi:excisionase family DNA binding protein